jgi:hypothetical protein
MSDQQFLDLVVASFIGATLALLARAVLLTLWRIKR